jgi:NADPH-dependent 2,4-dienoyl-CoA reductase/sulfur reductase-like enzyme
VRGADVDVLIAGGGLAAQRCCETLRRHGFAGSIAVLCEESSRPYDRPPLSKDVLVGAEEPQQPRFKAGEWYERQGVELLLGVRARELDPHSHTVSIAGAGSRSAGGSLRFERLVIATGSRPRRIERLQAGGVVHELRTYEDALALRAALREREGPLAIIGAGLIGMEVASSARALGREVTMIEAAATPLARALPPALGRWMAAFHHDHGVTVRLATTVRNARRKRGEVALELSDGSSLRARTVLLAAGIEPATGWLSSSGLGPGAILTDVHGRTALPRIYAAGDAACAADPYLGEALPTQHWEAAARQGAAVARTILDLPPAPATPPMFWSDQHGRRIQLVGHARPECLIELRGDVTGGAPFVAWMHHGGRPCAALLVDRPDLLPEARR